MFMLIFKSFHWSENLGGVVAVFVAASLVRPTPIVLGIFSFIFGQVIVRTNRKSRMSR